MCAVSIAFLSLLVSVKPYKRPVDDFIAITSQVRATFVGTYSSGATSSVWYACSDAHALTRVGILRWPSSASSCARC